MKKILVAAIIGIATVGSVLAQGRIALDTYNASPYPAITYGAGAGGSGTVNAGYTIGFYYSLTPDTFNDGTGVGIPGGTFLLGSGLNSTTPIVAGGLFAATGDFTVPGWAAGSVYLVAVAYNGASYENSTVRGHSAVFTLTPAINTDAAPKFGSQMTPFQVLPVAIIPEPSTFALAGLGLASLVIFRRRK
jgi:hypothetical protein